MNFYLFYTTRKYSLSSHITSNARFRFYLTTADGTSYTLLRAESCALLICIIFIVINVSIFYTTRKE